MLLKNLSSLLWNKKESILFHQKGFSMVELLLSVGALSLFAILVQSMLILGHSFTRSQQNLFDFIQATQMIKQKICVSNMSFKNINLDVTKSYKRNVTPVPKTDENGDPYVVHTRDYEKLDPVTGVVPIMGLSVFNIHSDPAFRDAILNPALLSSSNIDKDTSDIDSDGNSNEPVYYKVFQNSHTVVKMNFDSATINTAGGFLSGYIFASRCVKNSDDSIHRSGSHQFTFNPQALKKSAFYILSELDYKPYYFPRTESDRDDDDDYAVQCCTDGAIKSSCVAAKAGWVPRIYVIHLQPIPAGGVMPASNYGFSGDVSYIQELPEMQDLNNIWGMGFMLSMEEKSSLSQSIFQLDTMFLNNSCATSVTNIQKCRDISLGTDLSTQSLLGVDTSVREMKTDKYIIPDVSSCAGYSSGVDTTSLITL
jgi:hypothetical protein